MEWIIAIFKLSLLALRKLAESEIQIREDGLQRWMNDFPETFSLKIKQLRRKSTFLAKTFLKSLNSLK